MKRAYPMRTMHRQLTPLILVLVFTASPAFSQPLPEPDPQPGRGSDPATASDAEVLAAPEAVVERALAANPTLQAVRERIAAMEQTVVQAGVWADPRAAVEYSNMPFETPYPGHHPMSGVQLRLEQTFPWFGKIGAREAVASGRVEVAKAELAEERNRLAGLVRDSYHALALTRQLRAVTLAHIELVAQFMDAVRVTYEAGRAAQHELLRLQVLHDRLRDDLADFDQDEVSLLAGLNAALHRDVDAPVATPDVTVPPEPTGTVEALAERAVAERPLLARIRAEAAVERLEADRAEAERAPDVTAWAGYRYREAIEVPGGDAGSDFFSVGVSIPLPWFWNDQRWGAQAEERRAQARAIDARFEAALDDLRGDLGRVLSRWRRAAGKYRTYQNELVPEAQQALDSTFAAYRVARADFASLYQAELQLLDFERAILAARTEAARAAVRIDTLVGTAATVDPQEED